MSKWQFQRGDVPVGCLVGLVVALAVVLISIKMAPVAIHMGELDKEISVLADRANRRDYKDPRIINDILYQAEKLDLPVTKKDIKINRTSSRIKIDVTYEVPIDFPGYTYVWHKEHHHDRPLIEF